MSNDVQVTMTAATGSAQQAWMQLIGILGQVEQKLTNLGTKGQEAGQKTGQAMTGVQQSIKRIGQDLMTFVGVGGPLGLMYTTAQTVRQEFEAIKMMSREAQDFNVQRATALKMAVTAMGFTRTDSQGKPFGMPELDRLVSQQATEKRVSQIGALKSMQSLFAAGGDIEPDILANMQFRVAETFPELGTPDKFEELGKVSQGVAELMKAEKAAGRKLDADQAIAAFLRFNELSRSETPEEFSHTFTSFMGEGLRASKGKDNMTDLGSMFAAAQQAGVDVQGRRTATNLLLMFEEVKKATATIPEMRDMGNFERVAAVREAKTPELLKARKSLTGSFDASTTDEEIRRLGFQKGELAGEARQRGIMRALLTPESDVVRVMEEYQQRSKNVTSPEEVRKIISENEARMRDPAMLPLQQQRTKMALDEAGNVTLREKARREMAVSIVEDTSKKLDLGPMGLKFPVSWGADLRRMVGGSSDDLLKQGILKFEDAIQTLEREITAPQTKFDRSALQEQKQVLETGVRLLVSDLKMVIQERGGNPRETERTVEKDYNAALGSIYERISDPRDTRRVQDAADAAMAARKKKSNNTDAGVGDVVEIVDVETEKARQKLADAKSRAASAAGPGEESEAIAEMERQRRRIKEFGRLRKDLLPFVGKAEAANERQPVKPISSNEVLKTLGKVAGGTPDESLLISRHSAREALSVLENKSPQEGITALEREADRVASESEIELGRSRTEMIAPSGLFPTTNTDQFKKRGESLARKAAELREVASKLRGEIGSVAPAEIRPGQVLDMPSLRSALLRRIDKMEGGSESATDAKSIVESAIDSKGKSATVDDAIDALEREKNKSSRISEGLYQQGQSERTTWFFPSEKRAKELESKADEAKRKADSLRDIAKMLRESSGEITSEARVSIGKNGLPIPDGMVAAEDYKGTIVEQLQDAKQFTEDLLPGHAKQLKIFEPPKEPSGKDWQFQGNEAASNAVPATMADGELKSVLLQLAHALNNIGPAMSVSLDSSGLDRLAVSMDRMTALLMQQARESIQPLDRSDVPMGGAERPGGERLSR